MEMRPVGVSSWNNLIFFFFHSSKMKEEFLVGEVWRVKGEGNKQAGDLRFGIIPFTPYVAGRRASFSLICHREQNDLEEQEKGIS